MTPAAINKERLFRLWCELLVLTVVTVPIAIGFLDRPVALFCRDTIHLYGLKKFAPSSHLLVLILSSVALVIGLYCILRKQFPRWAEALLLAVLAAGATSHLTSRVIKYYFIRPGPRMFITQLQVHLGLHNQSLAFGAFPSTHAALVTAGLSVLGFYFPDRRSLCVVGLLAINVLLVLGRWHAISDVLAGDFVGFTAAALAWTAVMALKARRNSVT